MFLSNDLERNIINKVHIGSVKQYFRKVVAITDTFRSIMTKIRQWGAFRLLWSLVFIIIAGTLQAETSSTNALLLKPGMRLAIIGDSITQQKIYSMYLECYLTMCVPELNIQTCQFGWSGEKAGGFLQRMQYDLGNFRPNMVTICYGMNDGGYQKYTPAIGETYEKAMREIMTRLTQSNVTVIVGGPGAVDTRYYHSGDTNAAEIYNHNLEQLSALAEKLAEKFKMPFAGLHRQMIEVMAKAKAAKGSDYDVCGKDGIHPGPNGHLIMADAFLKAMGLDGNIGTITVDMKQNSVAATAGHKVTSFKAGKVELESARYPFCNCPKDILPYLPFNEDLNRFILKVNNLETDKAKITWGDKSKEFSRQELEKGINLAADFPENPFCAPFRKLQEDIAKKQSYETFMIKAMISSFPTLIGYLQNSAGVSSSCELIGSELWKEEARQTEQIRKAFVPVKHMLQVEEVTPQKPR